MRRITVPRLLLAAMLLTGIFLFSGCGLFSSPQNTFSPTGEVARDQKNLFLLTMWPALVIMIGVEFGLLYILWRFRHKKGDALPAQTHGNNRLEIAWTVAPIILLAFFIAPTVGGIVDLGSTPKDSVEIDVTGVQWAWQFSYPDPAGGAPIQAPIGEMHIPLGRNVALKLHSGASKTNDVIHSFWVPKLAGKTDVIPGRTNHMWLKGEEVGVFEGQCAEFCGTGHAQMRFTVTVQTADEFDAWLKAQAAAQRADDAPELARQGD